MKPKRVFPSIFLVLLLIAGGGYYFLRGGAPTEADGPPQGGGLPVVGYTLAPESLKAEITSVGTLEAGESATLRAEVPGMVAAIHFTEGATVKQGDLLLEIDARTYQESYNEAKAAYELARLTEGRRRKLLKNKFVAEQAVDEAKSNLQATEAAMESAKLRLEKTKITAPFDGVVGLRSLSMGDFLSVGDAITDVVSLDPMKVQVAVPERYFSRLRDKLAVNISVDAWPGKVFTGELYAIAPSVDSATRNMTVKAIVRNEDRELRPGMYARVNLELGEDEDALMLPEEAVIPQGEAKSVMKVVDGKVEIAPVTLGVRRKGKVEVLSGLAAGDVVITAGQMKVGPGMPVTVLPAEGAPAAGDGEPENGNQKSEQ